MSHPYSAAELTECFFEELAQFNACLDTDMCRDTVVLAFFVPDNGAKVYEQFCKAYFPKYLSEPYKEPGYFETFAAQAFVGDTNYGVLIRSDLDYPLDEMRRIFLHEISHLYCTRHETESGNFFDKYCSGSGAEDGMMNAGYAIWREAIADIMADSIEIEYAQIALPLVKGTIKELYGKLSADNPESKKAMSLIIAYVMISAEVADTKKWETAEKAIRRAKITDNQLLISMLKQVFDQMQRKPPWKITPEFIMTLGETYLTMLAGIKLREAMNLSDEQKT